VDDRSWKEVVASNLECLQRHLLTHEQFSSVHMDLPLNPSASMWLARLSDQGSIDISADSALSGLILPIPTPTSVAMP